MDPTKVKSVRTYAYTGHYFALAFDQSARKLYAGADDFAVHVFDLNSDKKEPVAQWTEHDSYVSAVAFVERAGKKLVVSGGFDQKLIWWDAESGKPIHSLQAHDGWVRDLIATPDGSRLISCGDDMLVKVWDTDSGKLLQSFEGHAQQTPQGHVTALYVVALSPDGKYLASADRIGDVRIWDLAGGKQVQSLQVPILYTYDPKQRKRSIGGIRALAFSRDGNELAVGGVGQVNNVDGILGPVHVEVWDWRKPQQRFAAGAESHQGIIDRLAYHPTEPWLIGAGGGTGNAFLAFWKIAADAKAPAATHRVKADGHIRAFCLNSAGTELYAAGFKKLEVWSLG